MMHRTLSVHLRQVPFGHNASATVPHVLAVHRAGCTASQPAHAQLSNQAHPHLAPASLSLCVCAGFGFAEFTDAEGVLRAIRLLNGLKLDGQELLLKSNTATQKYVEAYEAQLACEKGERQAKASAEKEAGELAGEAADGVDDGQVGSRVLWRGFRVGLGCLQGSQ